MKLVFVSFTRLDFNILIIFLRQAALYHHISIVFSLAVLYS